MHLSLLRSAASSSLLFDKRVDTSRYSGMRDAFACADRGNGPNGDLVVLSLACLFKGDDSDVKVNGANDAVKVADEKTSTAEKIINDFQGRIVSVRRSLIERGAVHFRSLFKYEVSRWRIMRSQQGRRRRMRVHCPVRRSQGRTSHGTLE